MGGAVRRRLPTKLICGERLAAKDGLNNISYMVRERERERERERDWATETKRT